MPSPVDEVATQVQNLSNTRSAKRQVAVAKDFSDNIPKIVGRQVYNRLAHALARAVGKKRKPSRQAAEALPFLVEAGGDASGLRAFADRIRSSPFAGTFWGKRALKAIDFALNNLEPLKPVGQLIAQVLEERIRTEQGKGFPTPWRANYFPHEQELKTEFPLPLLRRRGQGRSFMHMRTHDTLADSIAAGVKPRTLNGLDLLEGRVRKGVRMETAREFLQTAREIVDQTTGRPLITDLETVTVPMADGKIRTDVRPPRGYTSFSWGPITVAAHDGYAGFFRAITGESAVRNAFAGQLLLTTVGGVKHGLLLFDTFHLARVAFYRMLLHPLTTLRGRASYKKGLLLLDQDDAELRTMAAKGELPREHLEEALENRAILDLGLKRGVNLGNIAENIAPHFIRRLPVIGRFNRFLFDEFLRGGMAQSFIIEFRRVRRIMPELTPEQVADRVGSDINTRFGQLNTQGWFKSKTMQDLLRLAFLAPQWNEGLIRSEAGAVREVGEAVLQRRGRQLLGGTLARQAAIGIAGFFAMNQIINYMTRGKPTWENEEEGPDRKISAYIPDYIGGGPGFFLNPLALVGEITHQILGRLEKRPTTIEALADVTSYKLGPLVKAAAAGYQTAKTSRSDWEAVKRFGVGMLPVPIAAPALVGAGRSLGGGSLAEQYPGQFQRQLLSSVGLRTDIAPSPERRIRDLALDYRTNAGFPPQPDYYPSEYAELENAVRNADWAGADAAMEELLKQKTRSQIVEHFIDRVSRSFTSGTLRQERSFIRGLTPQQQRLYDQALRNRIELSREFLAHYSPRNLTHRPASALVRDVRRHFNEARTERRTLLKKRL